MQQSFRLYSDLAWLWPLWGGATAEYAHYCQHVYGLIRRFSKRPVSTLLDIGCGGGKNLFNLKRDFLVTGLDLSPQMLAQAQTLNPEVALVQADMRQFRLEQRFDAVLMDDAMAHMNNRADVQAVLRATYEHLQPGGVLVMTPDVLLENFQQNSTTVYSAEAEGLGVVFVENRYDPDPQDEHYDTTVLYLIREQGRLRIEQDHWRMGLFTLDNWRGFLRDSGFQVHEQQYRLAGEDYLSFACVKPR